MQLSFSEDHELGSSYRGKLTPTAVTPKVILDLSIDYYEETKEVPVYFTDFDDDKLLQQQSPPKNDTFKYPTYFDDLISDGVSEVEAMEFEFQT